MKARQAIGFLIVFLPGVLLPAMGAPRWTASWAASQQIPEPANSVAPADLTDATLRQIVHLSIGGKQLRVHLSNVFGTAPLHITAAHIARPVSPASAAIVAPSDTPLLFSGRADVTIPAGADYVSDPVDFPMAPLSDLAVTIHYDAAPAQETGHPGSRSTSYIVHGDAVSQADLPGAKTYDHWYQLSAVDVAANGQVIVALGDSITDGHNAITNANDRWTDELAKRLVAAHRKIAVINEGIGGNHLLTDGLGPNTLARFDRDVLSPAGVRYVIVLEGINDLGKLSLTADPAPADHEALVQGIIGAYRQIVMRAHAHGIRVIGATVMPFIGSQYYHPGPANDADRLAVNRWIRTPGNFDAVIDFDALMRDPANPGQLAPGLGSGDFLHPTPQGYAAMGDAIPLSLFSSVQTKKSKTRE